MVDNKVNFAILNVDKEKVREFILCGIRGEIQLEFMNKKTNRYQALNKHQLNEILKAHPEKIIIEMERGSCHPITYRPIIGYHQRISYQDLWFEELEFKLILEKDRNILGQNKSILPNNLIHQQEIHSKNEKDIDPRERNSLYRIIAGLIHSKYTYNPDDLKSDVPQKICILIMNTIGENIDAETLRNHIKPATRKYPKLSKTNTP